VLHSSLMTAEMRRRGAEHVVAVCCCSINMEQENKSPKAQWSDDFGGACHGHQHAAVVPSIPSAATFLLSSSEPNLMQANKNAHTHNTLSSSSISASNSSIFIGISSTDQKMQRLASNGTHPSKDPESRGLKSKASRYFGRTPSFASFKSAPPTTGSNTKASGAGDTGKKNNPIFRAGRGVSSLATRLSLFKRESAYHMTPATTR